MAKTTRAAKAAPRKRASKIVRRSRTTNSCKDPHPQPLPARGRGVRRGATKLAGRQKTASSNKKFHPAARSPKRKGGPVPGTPSPLSLVDRAYLIHDGRVMIQGKPEIITNDPEARRVYLGESFSV